MPTPAADPWSALSGRLEPFLLAAVGGPLLQLYRAELKDAQTYTDFGGDVRAVQVRPRTPAQSTAACRSRCWRGSTACGSR